MKRLLKEKLCAWALASVTLLSTVASSGMVYADTSTVTDTGSVSTQASEGATGKVAFNLPKSGGSLTVNIERSETQKDSTVIDIDDSGKTVVNTNGTESVVDATEDGYSYVMEEPVGTELEIILQCDDGWDVSLYKVMSDSGDVLTEKDSMELTPFSQNLTDVGYKETLSVSESLQVVNVSFEEVEETPTTTPDPANAEKEAVSNKTDTTTEKDASTANDKSNVVSTDKGDTSKPESTKDSKDEAKDTDIKDEAKDTDIKDEAEGTVTVESSTAEPDESKAEIFAVVDPDTGEVEMKNGGISTFSVAQDSSYVVLSERFDVFDDPAKPAATDPRLGMGIKYISGDADRTDSLGLWRLVYCLEYQNAAPVGETATYSSWKNRQVAYAVYYGCNYWGQYNRYSKYSAKAETSDWRYDYYITQWAVHILNGELTFDKFQSAVNSTPYYENKYYKAVVIDRVNNLVNDARNASNYTSFTNDGWFDMSQGTFAVGGNSNTSQSFTFTKSGDNWYSPWYSPTYNSYYGYEARNFVDSLTFSVPSGVVVERNDAEISTYHNTTMRAFRFRISNATYESLGGQNISIAVKMQAKKYWGIAEYGCNTVRPNGEKVQDLGIWTWSSSGGDFSKSITLKTTIPEQNGKAFLTKSSSNATLVSGNSNYSLSGAEYTVYSDSACTKKVATLITGSNGKSDTVELKKGTYYVKETKASKGYLKDSTKYTLTVKANETTELKVQEVPMKVTINLSKVSGNTAVTNGNANYSLKGAVYGVYRNSSCTDLVSKITTDTNGKASLANLALNQYYVKELTPSQGYELDTKVYTVDARTGSAEVNTKTVTSVETPKTDPVSVLLKKQDAETGDKVQGNASLEGAQFEVKFYDERMDTDPGAAGHQPLRTWVFQTKENPVSHISEVQYLQSYLVSGDELYLDSDGTPSLPYGTVTIKEIVAPDGYLLNDETFVVKIGETLSVGPVYHEPIIKDVALSIDIKKVQSGTSYPIQGVVFKHTGPDGFTEEATTDANGNVSFNGLTHGNHTVEEIRTVDGFALNTQKITFTVNRDNSIKITSSSTITDTNGKITVTVGSDGNIDATVENKPAPYDLHIYKINNHDFALQGAEFTLYSDSGCVTEVDKQTTDSAGNLTFEDLIVGKTYYMKETKAPQGYRIPVNDDGSDIVWTITTESYPTEGIFNFIVNGVTYTDKSTGSYTVTGTTAKRIANMTVVNEVGLKLPNTGSNVMIFLIAAGVALMAGTIIISRTPKMKKKRTEE